jgi:hypothetical protein
MGLNKESSMSWMRYPMMYQMLVARLVARLVVLNQMRYLMV